MRLPWVSLAARVTDWVSDHRLLRIGAALRPVPALSIGVPYPVLLCSRLGYESAHAGGVARRGRTSPRGVVPSSTARVCTSCFVVVI